jgi:hypothetical protein
MSQVMWSAALQDMQPQPVLVDVCRRRTRAIRQQMPTFPAPTFPALTDQTIIAAKAWCNDDIEYEGDEISTDASRVR